jgi:hypothetical protein
MEKSLVSGVVSVPLTRLHAAARRLAVTDVTGRPHHFVQGRPVTQLF